jgi:uncharacterized membrane protein YgcG
VSLIAVVTAVGLALALLLNLVATAFIVHSECGSAIQKAIQLIITWGIPFVGSIIIIAVLRATRPERKRRFDSGSSGNSWMPGVVPESESGHGHHHGHGESGGDGGHGGDAGGGAH